MSWRDTFKSGVFEENALMRLMIGLCATLAVSNKVEGAFFMGMAVMFVLVMSNVIVSAVRRLIPSDVRIPIFIVVIASFVTIVDLTMHAFLPSVYALLGIWIPLIVVNCIILGRAEAFAYKNTVWLSLADGLGKGAGFSMVIVVLALFRELFGTGRIVFLGSVLVQMPALYRPPSLLVIFPGAFILFGLMMAAFNGLESWAAERRAAEAKVVPVAMEEVAEA